jgi:hypothetical protein
MHPNSKLVADWFIQAYTKGTINMIFRYLIGRLSD